MPTSSEETKMYMTAKVWLKYGYQPPGIPKPGDEKYIPNVDCFAWREQGCDCLNYTWCRYEKCRFYKNKEELTNGNTLRTH